MGGDGKVLLELGDGMRAVEQHGRDPEPLQFLSTGVVATGSGHLPAFRPEAPRQRGGAVAEAEAEEMGRFGHASYPPSRLAFSRRRHDVLRRAPLLSGGRLASDRNLSR